MSATTNVTVRVWPVGGPLYRASIEILNNSTAALLFGDREFDSLDAALIHCAQMLRLLADDKTALPGFDALDRKAAE